MHSGRAMNYFKNTYEKMTGLHNSAWHYYVHWLYEFTRISFRPYSLRPRMTPIGSLTNSDIRLANKDIININLAKDKMSQGLREELVRWLEFKATWQPKNYIIAGDNDGFINFINAQRGLNYANRYKGGQLDTSYFPQISYRRIKEIAVRNQKPIFMFDGRTNLMDAKVYQEGRGNYYATLGMTGMAGGGKGIVGYRIFASDDTSVNNWVFNERKPRLPASYSDAIDKVTPMFEITNEGSAEYRTPGFENLGYTYSGFEYFNRLIDVNGQKQGQAVAVFGNGFGGDKSTIYFIDAYTGKKLNEIILNPKGGGAATPAIVVEADPITGQRLKRLYVGDYSGTLYRVEFTDRDFTDNHGIRVTSLFKAPETNIGQSAISTRPLVLKNKAGQMQVFFGTGIAANKQRDRGDNAAVLHGIYGITDRDLFGNGSSAMASDMDLPYVGTLSPKLSVNNLKRGDVKYSQGTQIDYLQKDRYDIDIETPESTNPNETGPNGNGWYVRLSADGMKSGERVIQDPKYDGLTKNIIFSTWGVVEREDVNDLDLPDPCLKDTPFGKILAFNISTGGAGKGGNGTGSNGKIDNVGSVGKIPGGVTGDLIGTSPEDNSSTTIEDLGKKQTEKIIEIVGKDDSSLYKNEEIPAAKCEGDTDAEGHCIIIENRQEKTESLFEHRISIQQIL